MADAELVSGRATPRGTERFAARFSALPGHFRRPDRLAWSSLALGLRGGRPGGADDLLYRSAVAQCVEGGVNVFATALSDRMQTSERALGNALRRAFREGRAARDEIVVVTQGGFLTPDPDLADPSLVRHALERSYVRTGLVDPTQVVDGVHCIAPAFLSDQIDRSRRNLGLATLDVWLVQEPELHLRRLGPSGFERALREIFEMLEKAVQEARIAAYGLSTWAGLLLPESERHHLSIVEVFEAALEASGGEPHLAALQLPYSVAMGEAVGLPSQLAPDGRAASVLHSLDGTGVAALASAPLAQGRVLGKLPGWLRRALPGLPGDAQRCLQIVRSTRNVTSAVAGMRDPDHVLENLATARHAPLEPGFVESLFRRGGR
jgi:aryl-alcohol dehydrogenase-like predicted oxidoreductase